MPSAWCKWSSPCQVFFTVHSGVMICTPWHASLKDGRNSWIFEASEMPELDQTPVRDMEIGLDGGSSSRSLHQLYHEANKFWGWSTDCTIRSGVLLGALLTGIVSAGMAAFSKGGKALWLTGKWLLCSDPQTPNFHWLWAFDPLPVQHVKASYLARLLGFLAPRGCKIRSVVRTFCVWLVFMADKVDVRYHLRRHALRPAVLLVVGHFSGLSKSLRSPSSDLCHVRCPTVKSMSGLCWDGRFLSWFNFQQWS